MCYSGKCVWEGYTGDCDFPRVKEVRDKYPLPLCSRPDETDTDEERIELQEHIDDVNRIVLEFKLKITLNP